MTSQSVLSRDKTQPGPTKSVTVYPNGKFAIAHVAARKKGPRRNKLTRDEINTLSGLQAPASATFNKLKAGDCPLLGLYLLARGSVSERPGAHRPLGSSKRAKSHKRLPRGRKGISSKARDKISYCSAFLEWRHGRSNLSFLTLTLPDLTDEELGKVQASWSEIVRQLVQEIKRSLARKGVKTDVAGATEIQPERFRRTGQACPHLHLLFRGKRTPRSAWAMSWLDFRILFVRVLRNVAKIDIREERALENVQRVKRSVSAYLGKYLSKCASKDAPPRRVAMVALGLDRPVNAAAETLQTLHGEDDRRRGGRILVICIRGYTAAGDVHQASGGHDTQRPV